MKLVVTDGATLSGGGVSLDGFRRFGELVVYDLTAPEQLAERVGDADAVLCNKTPIPAELFDQCPNLRYVGECATGYNNIDIAAAKAHGVTVCNVGGYSTDAVAQHTFALILHHYSRVAEYDTAVRQGAWKQAKTFCVMPYPMQELAGKTLAVVGYGSIGRKVAAICAAPSVLGGLGILEGKKAACYPGFEDKLKGAEVVFDQVVRDGNVTTSRGMGTAIPFALDLVSQLVSEEKAQELKTGIIYG